MAYSKILSENLKKFTYGFSYIILYPNIKLLDNYRKTNNIIEFKFSNIYNIEAPAFLFNYLVNSIGIEIKTKGIFINTINIIHQIIVKNDIIMFKTPLQLFKTLCLLNYNNFCTGVFDNKIYYFSKGILLDEDFNVLFCINIVGKINVNYSDITEINSYLYVDSSIFEKTDRISSYIKNTFIPTFNYEMDKEEKIVIKKLDFIKQYHQYVVDQ